MENIKFSAVDYLFKLTGKGEMASYPNGIAFGLFGLLYIVTTAIGSVIAILYADHILWLFLVPFGLIFLWHGLGSYYAKKLNFKKAIALQSLTNDRNELEKIITRFLTCKYISNLDAYDGRYQIIACLQLYKECNIQDKKIEDRLIDKVAQIKEAYNGRGETGKRNIMEVTDVLQVVFPDRVEKLKIQI